METPDLLASYWHHFTIRGKQVELYDGISLIAFAQVNPQYTPGATGGADMDRFISNLVNLPSHLVGKLGDVALT